MPFTVAHPAIVLPLKRFFPRYLSLTGLMAGAMSPDLIYFLGFSTAYRGLSHSWAGLFWFCVPAGVLFSIAFHRLFKAPFIGNLPDPLDRHFSGLATQEWRIEGSRGWVTLTLSVLTGALSHFFWDSFTHPGGEIARAIPLLGEYHHLMGLWLSNASVMQHLSTVVGMSVLTVAACKGKYLPPPVSDWRGTAKGGKTGFWLAGTAVAGLFGIGAVLANQTILSKDGVPSANVFGVSSWAGFFYFVVIYGLARKPSLLKILEENR
ncbi:MAG: DUF4184 family protein [Candidatus Zixiibacteriota bacterium]